MYYSQVVLSRQGGERSRVWWRAGACDGAWHAVRARATPRALELQLDGGQVQRDAPTALLLDSSDSPPTPTALYIGGLPGMSYDSSLI